MVKLGNKLLKRALKWRDMGRHLHFGRTKISKISIRFTRTDLISERKLLRKREERTQSK